MIQMMNKNVTYINRVFFKSEVVTPGWSKDYTHWTVLKLSVVHCTLGEEVHLENKIFENKLFKYKKITKNILTVEKKFHNFSTKNDQHFLGANFFGTDTFL